MNQFYNINFFEIVSSFFPEPNQDIHLFDRELGQKIREKIEQIFSGISNETVFFLNFKNICSIDYSCADELVGKLISRLLADEYGSIYFVLKNLNRNHQENIQVVFDRRKVGCLEQTENNGWNFWGHRTNSLLETLSLIMDKGEITARELKEHFNLELSTSSTRLSQLCKAHLVSRDQVVINGGGMEYLYKKLF